ncbi:MAG: TIGR00366 family protein [Youngiibacter sp.]|nr:TIGR00366 family protein [Youngiibacter sp.]
MFKKIVNATNHLVQRYLPDAYIFAVIITLIVLVLGLVITGQNPLNMINNWGNGFWTLIPFAMQMTLLICTGFILADTPPVRKFLDRISGIPKTPRGAIYFITVVSFIAFYVNSGLALIVGPLLARGLAKRIKGVDYRLLVASGYINAISLQGGLTGAIALKLASGGDSLIKETGGVLSSLIPMTQTVFTWWNILLQALLLLVLPLVNSYMHPAPKDTVTIDPSLLAEDEDALAKTTKKKSEMTPAERMENSRVISILIGVMGLIYIGTTFMKKGIAASFDFNTINFTCLFLAILLHGTPTRFLKSVKDSATAGISIIIQFPFYAGVMGMMTGVNASGISVAKYLTDAFLSVATVPTFPILLFLAAGIINFFIPSGGGHWAVLGPIMMPAGAVLGINPAITAMIIAYGGAWSDGVQPFWALPSLGIAKLGVRDIMGFCIIDVLVAGVIMMSVFTLAVLV